MGLLEPLRFEDDANLEHQKILQAKTRSALGAWELGARLLRFQTTKEWMRVTVGGPYQNFLDYLSRGVAVSVSTAKIYMRAAELPREAALRFGIHGAAMLKSILELTEQEESLDEALELKVESEDGTLRPWAGLTYEEREAAVARARAGSPLTVKGVGRPSPERVAANAFRDRLRSAVVSWMSEGQVTAKLVDNVAYVALKAIPVSAAKQVFEALAKL